MLSRYESEPAFLVPGDSKGIRSLLLFALLLLLAIAFAGARQGTSAGVFFAWASSGAAVLILVGLLWMRDKAIAALYLTPSRAVLVGPNSTQAVAWSDVTGVRIDLTNRVFPVRSVGSGYTGRSEYVVLDADTDRIVGTGSLRNYLNRRLLQFLRRAVAPGSFVISSTLFDVGTDRLWSLVAFCWSVEDPAIVGTPEGITAWAAFEAEGGR